MHVSQPLAHFLWLRPEQADGNKHIRSMIAREAAACTDLRAVFFQGDRYLAESEGAAPPDLVVLFGSLYRSHLDVYTLVAGIRARTTAPIAAWLSDDPYEFDANYGLPALVDWVFSNDRASCPCYHSERVRHLPLAAAETLPAVSAPDAPPEWDFVFCGASFANRVALVEGLHPILARYRTLLIGNNSQPDRDARWPKEKLPGLSFQDSIGYADLLSVYQRSKIVLNFSRSLSFCNRLYEIVPSTPAPRTFEVAMLGALQFAFFDKPELLDYFDRDEIVVFDTREEFARLAERYLNDDGLRERTAHKARQRARREHLYRHRLRTLVRTIFSDQPLVDDPASDLQLEAAQ